MLVALGVRPGETVRLSEAETMRVSLRLIDNEGGRQ